MKSPERESLPELELEDNRLNLEESFEIPIISTDSIEFEEVFGSIKDMYISWKKVYSILGILPPSSRKECKKAQKQRYKEDKEIISGIFNQ
jgi:hypothetical protein